MAADHPALNAIRFTLEYFGLGHRITPFPVRREAGAWTQEQITIPPDCEVKAPDFVGVGTQKSGTSWWASLIEAHPQVSENLFHRKEMHYLTHFFDRPLSDRDIRTYHAVFARPAGQLCGEWTPNYLASPYTMVRLRQAAPAARVLTMFRDPISRFESGFNHEFKQRFGAVIGPKVRLKVIKEYALRKESIWNGMYAAQCDALLRQFPREQILILQYERCRREPEEMLRKTYRFLGLDPDFRPERMNQPVNVQRKVAAPLGEEGQAMLREVYANDVQRLSTLFPGDIDLRLWGV